MSTASLPRRAHGVALRERPAPPSLQSIPFAPKHVSIGMTVLWFKNGNAGTKPLVATITEIHGADRRRISLRDPNGWVSQHPVLHGLDPLTQNKYEIDNGFWDYTDEYKDAEDLRSEVARLLVTNQHLIALASHTQKCVEQLAAKLGETLPAFTGEIPTAEAAAGETGRSELSDEEAKRQQAELLAMLDADEAREAAEGAPELATENESIPASERVAMGGGRRRR